MASTCDAISGIVFSQYDRPGWVMSLQCFGCTLDTWGKCGVGAQAREPEDIFAVCVARLEVGWLDLAGAMFRELIERSQPAFCTLLLHCESHSHSHTRTHTHTQSHTYTLAHIHAYTHKLRETETDLTCLLACRTTGSGSPCRSDGYDSKGNK